MGKTVTSKPSAMSLAMPNRPALDLDYQGEDDHRTLSRAEEIRGDASRMKGVQRHHRKQTRALSAVGRAIGGKR